MKNIFIILTFFIFISNCTLNKVVKNHGTNFIDKKEKKLIINSSNRNDIIKILGPPSTKSIFRNDLWIYIEKKTTKKSLLTLGGNKILANNVLILEINSRGLLVKKDLYQLDKMNEINFTKDTTEINYSQNTFVYDFLSSLKQKINNPKNNRKKKN